MNKTIEFYNLNANDFTHRRQSQDFSYFQDKFLEYLKPGAKILDFGSGSGRDLKYFKEKGFFPEGIDGSEKLAKIASGYSGCPVKVCDFLDFSPEKEYDGIWACASLLHLKEDEIRLVLEKIKAALKINGYLYFSFKKGSFKGMRDGRYFTDLTDDELDKLLKDLNGFDLVENFLSEEKRESSTVCWHNVILKRK